MTKKELVEMLSQFPDDMEVYIDKYTDEKYRDSNIWVSDVREPNSIKPIYRVKDMKIAQRAHPDTAGAKKCIIL